MDALQSLGLKEGVQLLRARQPSEDKQSAGMKRSYHNDQTRILGHEPQPNQKCV